MNGGEAMGKVILLFGGPTRERLVSVASAQNVARILGAPRCCFWATDGAVHEVSVASLVAHERPFELDFAPPGKPRWSELKRALVDWADERELVVFLALHGGVAEDGTLQGWLEEHRIAYTGSDSRASREAFDKTRARTVAAAAGLRVAEAAVLEPNDVPRARARILDLLDRFPRVVLKPVADGSSMGLRFVSDRAEVEPALRALKDEAVVYLAEAFVQGTELTVGVLDAEDGLRALPCSEVRISADASFDYAAKYLGRGVREITPAEVAPATAAEAQRAALVAHRALGCAGYSRTDLIVDARGPVYLETNTLPGLTRASFIPQQLEAAGIPMRAFVERQLALARRRAAGG
jgi:D-alanine-D-alanine ligase